MNYSDVSVVIQGPIYKDGAEHRFTTKEVIEQVRRLMDGCEVVLSTWDYEDVHGLMADQVILNRDPGATVFEDGSSKPNNINRMLVSTGAGVNAATRKYIFKIRSDMMPTTTGFVTIWERLSKEPKYFKMFSRQVMAYPLYTLLHEGEGNSLMPKPFHLSDWVFFGLTEDVKFLFDIPLVREPDFSRYFLDHNSDAFDTIPNIKWRYSPEQYLFYRSFSKRYCVKFENKRDYDIDNIRVSFRALFGNFIFIDMDMWGLRHNKDFYNRPIYEFDPNCYGGIVGFYRCLLGRLKLGIDINVIMLARACYRQFIFDGKHRAING